MYKAHFARFAMPGLDTLGDSSSVAILDSAAQAAIYTAVVKTDRDRRKEKQLMGRDWLWTDPLGHTSYGMGGHTDRNASLNVGTLRSVVANLDLHGVCKHGETKCPDARSGETAYILSRIYRIDSSAVRVFAWIRSPPVGWDDPQAQIFIEQSRLEVYRVERRDDSWAVAANEVVWIVD